MAEAISKWTWSGSPHMDTVFVYLSGKSKEIVVRPGVFRYELLAVGPDGGWGTYVSTRPEGRYKLVFENVDPDPKATSVANLVAMGGGWK